MAALRTVQGKACRVGSELRIQLLDGGTAVFKDVATPGMKFVAPRYAGYLKAIHSHVVHRIPYEGDGGYWIVDDSTGDPTYVLGIPVPSTDGTRFATTSMAGEARYDLSMIEVWRMVGRKPEQEFSLESATDAHPWEPSDAVWRDSVTIDFIKNSRSDPSNPFIKTPGRLTRIGTTWVLSDSLPNHR